MILLIGSQKGGSGKSTLAVNISALLAGKGFNVMLVDADRQTTAANWAGDREENLELSRVNCIQKYDNIRETLNDLNKHYDYVIVDAAGRDSKELRTGMVAADILLIPFKPSQPDLDTMPKMVELIGQAKDFNEALKVFGVITMAPSNPLINESNEAKEYLANYPEINLLKTLIRDRKVYRDAMSSGSGVTELKNPKAKAEVQLLVDEVMGW